MSSERSEARRKLRECDGLVDALIYIVQSEIGQKDSDSKVPQQGGVGACVKLCLCQPALAALRSLRWLKLMRQWENRRGESSPGTDLV